MEKNHFIFSELPRVRKRLTELMVKTATEPPSGAEADRQAQAKNEWGLKFLRSPLEFLPDGLGSRLGAIRLGINKLEVSESVFLFFFFFFQRVFYGHVRDNKFVVLQF